MDLLARVAWLFALVLYPGGLSPEPVEPPVWVAFLGVLLGLVALFGSYRFAKDYFGPEAKVAAALNVVGLVALFVGATRPAPLLATYYGVAPFVWLAVAGSLATLAGAHLGSRLKNKRAGAVALCIVGAFFGFRAEAKTIASERLMWLRVLAYAPAYDPALSKMAEDLADPTQGRDLLARCIEAKPSHCGCRTRRAEVALAADRWEAALADLDQVGECKGPDVARHARAKVLALALAKRVDEADALLAEAPVDDAWTHYARALVASERGDVPGGLAAAREAVDRGAGRGAKLLLGALAILAGDLDGATTILDELIRANKEDADALYNRALVADKQNDFNGARERYLKTLSARPNSPDARYNLALLTLRHGARAEAANHARKFSEGWPTDPRGPALQARIGAP
jgi:tetratricopeptide (TPR) repeat protein